MFHSTTPTPMSLPYNKLLHSCKLLLYPQVLDRAVKACQGKSYSLFVWRVGKEEKNCTTLHLGPMLLNFFASVIYKCSYLASVFVPGRPFLASLFNVYK